MGCNNSRLNASGEEVPPKIRPLLLRRIEELRKHNNGGGGEEEGAISKMHLLNDDTIIEAQSFSEDENNNMVLPKGIQLTREQNMVHVDKLSKVVPLPVSEYGSEDQHNKRKDPRHEKVKHVENDVEVDFHDGDNDDSDEDDEEEEVENNKGRLLGRGSPSFKIYIEPKKMIKEKERLANAGENWITSIENKKNAFENQAIVMHQKSPSSDSYQSAASQNSGSSNEAIEIESTTKRRRHKMKLGAVKKNLLNVKQVKHRMNPMFSCGGNDRKNLLSHK
ncbi:hypothetical protein TanjilG_30837 [Lupinus angustifolius]|uniref:Uncharacterized protein n=1 Tax=Lupinus angustifolius TaxID=3871 RepID=A0A394D9I0_LUPAN|nr:PREDICTED: uncharacterized protein LOC109337540 [Lupinus angustifolius]OIW19923.1 hypothetical protein TanjilG_30837 [Lupinus angustifolius]